MENFFSSVLYAEEKESSEMVPPSYLLLCKLSEDEVICMTGLAPNHYLSPFLWGSLQSLG